MNGGAAEISAENSDSYLRRRQNTRPKAVIIPAAAFIAMALYMRR